MRDVPQPWEQIRNLNAIEGLSLSDVMSLYEFEPIDTEDYRDGFSPL
jgi:hypothetical protein